MRDIQTDASVTKYHNRVTCTFLQRRNDVTILFLSISESDIDPFIEIVYIKKVTQNKLKLHLLIYI